MHKDVDVTDLTEKQIETLKKIELTQFEKELSTKAGTSHEDALAAKQNARATSMRNAAKFRIGAGKKDGVISVYGLGQRFPVSLRKKQWELIKANIDGIINFSG